LNTIDWSGHVTSTICRDNWFGFKSLLVRGTCVPNLSCNCFSQSCSGKGKI